MPKKRLQSECLVSLYWRSISLKAIIPVAGLGTRLLPATKSIPKELIPIVDKPLIHFIVEELVDAGVSEIVLVTHSSKAALENYFDLNFEVETTLTSRSKSEELTSLNSMQFEGLKLISVRQSRPMGLGHAIMCAEPIIGQEAFAVVLPDVIIDDAACNPKTDNLSQMIGNFEASGMSQLMVHPVSDQLVDQFGIVDIEGIDLKASRSAGIHAVVEKPSLKEAPSNFSITGRYVFDPVLWQELSNTKPGAGGEIQLTDALHGLLSKSHAIDAYHLVGRTFDCGSRLGLATANYEYAKRHALIGDDFSKYLEKGQL